MRSYTTVETDFGPCALAFSEQGLAALEMPASQHEPAAAVAARMEARGAAPLPGKPGRAAQAAARSLRRFFAGEAEDFRDLPIDLSGAPPFHGKAYEALRRVGKGELVSYQELAQRMGHPGAVRAVGQAMAKNPLPIVVPCHRVLAAGGKLGGFSAAGGLPVKARLLVFEGARRPEELLAATDPTLGRFMKKFGPFAPRRSPGDSIFLSLARAVAYQQLAGKAAETIWGRVAALYPQGITPQAVRETDPARLRAAGLSGAKTASILDLADKALAGVVPEEEELRRLPDAQIIERITQVRGIGPWTVEMLLLFRLGRLDVLPVTDFGVRKGFQLLYGLDEMPTPRELAEHGERWRPFRSVASWYLWRVLDPPAA